MSRCSKSWHGVSAVEAMTPKSRMGRSVGARPADRMPPSCSRPVSGTVIFGLAIQGLPAYTLLPEGRGSFALCVVFAGVLGVLFTPRAREGAQYFVMTKQATVSEGVGGALASCLVGGALAITLAIPFVHSDIAFFHKAETRSFYLALALVPVMASLGLGLPRPRRRGLLLAGIPAPRSAVVTLQAILDHIVHGAACIELRGKINEL